MTSTPIVVVTGANRGIGFEICRQLASRGAQVILTGRKREAGETAVKEIRHAESDCAVSTARCVVGEEHHRIARISETNLWAT
jgi:NAD(P)-dependent dehydrogenase (short-subunit alcohol dehydrogenase family)